MRSNTSLSAGMATPVMTAPCLVGNLLVGNTRGFLLTLVFSGGVGKDDWGRGWYFQSGYFFTKGLESLGRDGRPGAGGRPPGQGRLLGGLGRTLGVAGGVTSTGGLKLGWSSTGGRGVTRLVGLVLAVVEEGKVVSFPSLISFSRRSMKGSVATGLISGRGGSEGIFFVLILFLFPLSPVLTVVSSG